MNDDFVDDFSVRKMANLISKPLSDGRLRCQIMHQMSAWVNHSQAAAKSVVWITRPGGPFIHPKQKGKKWAMIRVRQ